MLFKSFNITVFISVICVSEHPKIDSFARLT
jgi:hypothetical protein